MTYLDSIGSTLGRFEILSESGRGGMAVVYLARQTDLGRDVALKILRPELAHQAETVARFHQEARSAAQLDHPNIVPIYDIGELETPTGTRLHYIAMKYIHGRTVKALLEEKGRLSVQQAVDLLGQVGAALDYAHQRGVIHRDIKPSNMFISEDGTVYLGDFGIACGIGNRTGLTQADVVMGTPEYMAPEQVEGRADVGPATDIYALGIALYEMLTGDYPFQADTPMGMAVARLQQEPRTPRSLRADVPPEVEGVIMQALARRPLDRFASVAAMLEALRYATSMAQRDTATRALPTQGKPATGPTMGMPQQGGSKRPPLIAWVLLPVLIVALVAPLGFVGFNIYQEMLRPPPVATPIALPPATPIPIVTPFATITPPPGRPTPTPPQMGELLASAQRSYDTANYDQAEDLYRWALNIDPRSAEAMTGLGWTLYELERYAEAHDAFVQSRDIDPDQSAVYNGLGWIAYANSDDRQAYAHFYKSVTIEPANANAYYGLGLTSERMGKNREAREAYQAALEIDPNDQAVHERLERLE